MLLAAAVALLVTRGFVPTAIAETPSLLRAEPVSADAARHEASSGLRWYAAQQIGVEGKGYRDTAADFARLPARAETLVRPPVWSLAQHSAGLCVRFTTDSSTVRANWTLTSASLAMPHMAATGVSGLDLYVQTASGWRWLGSGRPEQQQNAAVLVEGLAREPRNYLLYLPLYNGVQTLEIGVDAEATVHRQTWQGARARPIVFWGTSITQGGCASRTGMAHPAIVGRRLHRPVVNLGFSGNGKLEPEMARLIGELDACVFVLDCLPNLQAAEVRERTRPAVEILRAAHADTPILLVEDRTYSDAFLKESLAERNRASRQALRESFEQMQRDGIQGLHYLPGERLLGTDGEDTVDGSHPTDLGFQRQAAAFEAALRPLLEP